MRKASTLVMDHRAPLVDIPLLANIGVIHRYVVPNKNKATPPILRIVNMVSLPILATKGSMNVTLLR